MTTTPGGEEPTDVEDDESKAIADEVEEPGEEFPDDEDVEGHMFGSLSGLGLRPGGKPTTVTAGVFDGVNNDTLFAGPGDDSRFDEISRRKRF